MSTEERTYTYQGKKITRGEFKEIITRYVDQVATHLPISDYDAQNVQQVMEHGTNFSAHVLRLINKADANNRVRLAIVFPDHMKAWENWYFHN